MATGESTHLSSALSERSLHDYTETFFKDFNKLELEIQPPGDKSSQFEILDKFK